ncbi:MAG: GntR family transcriptional regulator [Lachnospiraceae bacterium]|nr:GntR family transcriptional regulator [Lachnospiraceae bacterium]
MTKHEEISRWLREKIADGGFPVNSKIPSENKLAARFGCSRQTVRQAIGTLEAAGIVSRAQGSGTFVSRRTAKTSRAATMRVGVITTYLDDYIFPGIIQGIERVLSARHYSMVLGITYNRQTDEESALRQMLENGVDGLIIEGTKTALPNVNELLYQEIIEHGIPIVFLNSCHRGCTEARVVMNDILAGELATNALISKKHRRLGGIFKSDDLQSLHRYEGMQRSVKQAGLSLPDASVLWYTTEDIPYLFSGSFDHMILSRFEHTTGLVCYNDQIAVSLIRLLHRYGKNVPDDYSIVSFDNSALAENIACGLTSVIYPAREIGEQAAGLLFKKLDDPSCREHIVIRPEIQFRSSVRSISEV